MVSLIETPDEKYVLKVALRTGGSSAEAVFLKAWENIGVATPHIFETGNLSGHFYMLLAHVSANPLTEDYSEQELVEKRMFYVMGKTLRQMHTVQGKGYGRITEKGVGEYVEFKDWISQDVQMNRQLAYAKEKDLLPAETGGSMEDAINILLKHVELDPVSVYCHYDFVPDNILNTHPITVFDPVPMFHHPYLDIGKSIASVVARFPMTETSQQLIEGYFSENGSANMKVLQAAILLMSCAKFSYWHKTGKTERIERVQAYLKAHKHLLG